MARGRPAKNQSNSPRGATYLVERPLIWDDGYQPGKVDEYGNPKGPVLKKHEINSVIKMTDPNLAERFVNLGTLRPISVSMDVDNDDNAESAPAADDQFQDV